MCVCVCVCVCVCESVCAGGAGFSAVLCLPPQVDGAEILAAGHGSSRAVGGDHKEQLTQTSTHTH